jgi:hypothetical protein
MSRSWFTHLSLIREDWYQIAATQVNKAGGNTLLRGVYSNSLYALLSTLYPQHTWLPWKFQAGVPSGFWETEANQRWFLDWVEKELGFTTWEDWYTVTSKMITDFGGKGLLSQYDNSLPTLVQKSYPQHAWLPWRFVERAPSIFWEDVEQQKQWLQLLSAELNIKHWEDWYQVTAQQISKHGGGPLLTLYQSSVARLIPALLPQHAWKPWKFADGVPASFWDQKSNLVLLIKMLEKELKITKAEDWYKVTLATLGKHAPSSVFRRHHLSELLQMAYPTQTWLPWKFSFGVPPSFWEKAENKVRFVEWLAKDMSIKQLDDWYKVTSSQIKDRGGGIKQREFAQMLRAMYPEHTWLPWRFIGGVPDGFWEEPANLRNFCDWLVKVGQMKAPHEIIHRPRHFFDEKGGLTFLRLGPIRQTLQIAYPGI